MQKTPLNGTGNEILWFPPKGIFAVIEHFRLNLGMGNCSYKEIYNGLVTSDIGSFRRCGSSTHLQNQKKKKGKHFNCHICHISTLSHFNSSTRYVHYRDEPKIAMISGSSFSSSSLVASLKYLNWNLNTGSEVGTMLRGSASNHALLKRESSCSRSLSTIA